MKRSLPNLPAELRLTVMENLPDLATLSRLFTACPNMVTTFRGTIKKGNKVFASIMANTSPELRYACLDVLAVRTLRPCRASEVTKFIKRYLDDKLHDTQLRRCQYPLTALLDLIAVAESLQSVTDSFASERVLNLCLPHTLPLSPVELHRIQRSFWRFQLCYDLCHPETVRSRPERFDFRSRSTRRYFQYEVSPPINGNVRIPNWLQCRGEPHRPKALSRFLVNLDTWEMFELHAIRFHLIHKVNTLQYRRSRISSKSEKDDLIQEGQQQPLLLHRLLRDLDNWDPKGNCKTDHVLVAFFAPNMCGNYPVVWDRKRYHYEASTGNIPPRFIIQVMQVRNPLAMQFRNWEWGWRLWDEKRLFQRGMIDFELEEWFQERKDHRKIGMDDDEDLNARIRDREAQIERANSECAGSQYTDMDRKLAARFCQDNNNFCWRFFERRQ